MRISLLFCALSLLSFPLLVTTSPLALPSVPTYLGAPNTFYRVVTGRELQEVTTIYHVGQSPTKLTNIPGDLSYAGGLYVFEVDMPFQLCYSDSDST